MSKDNTQFCRLLLSAAREDAIVKGVIIPRRLTAMRSDKKWFTVEGEGIEATMIEADNAYEAKAKFIHGLITAQKAQ